MDGRARPVAILMARVVTPASASAMSIARKIRIQALLPTANAIAIPIMPAITWAGQSPTLLTIRITRFNSAEEYVVIQFAVA